MGASVIHRCPLWWCPGQERAERGGMDEAGLVVVATRDARVRDAVEAAAATLGRAVEQVGDAAGALAAWPHAEALLIGADVAAGVAAAQPRRRAGVYLLGFPDAEPATWSVPLGAGVIPLPQGSMLLTDVLTGAPAAAGAVVAVVGGSGGVGASTLAAGLALDAARGGRSAAVLEVDEGSGGIDLLLGAERAPGWRWPRLVGARGEVGDVRSLLPRVSGVPFVAMGRGETAGPLPGDAVVAVLGTLARHHDLVVVDAGRAPTAVARHTVQTADAVLLVCAGDARGVAAAAATRDRFAWASGAVVVRAAAQGAVPEAVAAALGMPLAGVLPHDRRLPGAAAEGISPVAAGRRWRRAVGALASAVMPAAVTGGRDAR